MTFTEHSFESSHPEGTHRIVYSEFTGDPARTVICVHGLSRNGRDFDWLAEKLAADGHRVICPDMAGRGRSAPFANPAHYNNMQYVMDCVALIQHLGVSSIDWVGTSMGGIIGMVLAAQPQHPIRRMVINDMGAIVPRSAVQNIKTYVGQNPVFATWDDYYDAFVKRMEPFALSTDAQKRYLAETSLHRTPEGVYRLAYDVGIIAGLPAAEEITDVDLWPFWNQVTVPTLILHGANSDILSAETLEKMKAGKNVQSVTFPHVGHAPALMDDDQIEIVRDFLAD